MKLTFLVLFLFGNGQGDFLPTKRGTSWRYQSGVVQTIVGTEKVGGISCVVMETNRGGRKEKTWIQNSRGGLVIRRVSSRGQVNDLRSGALLLKFPLERGVTWKARIPFGNEVVEYSYRNLGKEKVRVPAGEFNAWKIQATGQVSGSRFSQVSWYSAWLSTTFSSRRINRHPANWTVLSFWTYLTSSETSRKKERKRKTWGRRPPPMADNPNLKQISGAHRKVRAFFYTP